MDEYEKISKKKPSYPIKPFFNEYLSNYNRNALIPVFYDDLLRFSGAIEVYDENEESYNLDCCPVFCCRLLSTGRSRKIPRHYNCCYRKRRGTYNI